MFSPAIMTLIGSLVFLWVLNAQRRSSLGVHSNFQPLLSALLLLVVIACIPSTLAIANSISEFEPSAADYNAAFAILYIFLIYLAIKAIFLFSSLLRGGVLPPQRHGHANSRNQDVER